MTDMTCQGCSGSLHFLGTLGWMMHYRCRQCGQGAVVGPDDIIDTDDCDLLDRLGDDLADDLPEVPA